MVTDNGKTNSWLLAARSLGFFIYLFIVLLESLELCKEVSVGDKNLL